MHTNFQQNRVIRSVKNRAHKFICKKIASYINLQITNNNILKSTYSDMHIIFGFKPKASTVLCSTLVNETIQYYTENGGNPE